MHWFEVRAHVQCGACAYAAAFFHGFGRQQAFNLLVLSWILDHASTTA